MTFATASPLAFLLALVTGCAQTAVRGHTEGAPTADPLADAPVVSGRLPNGLSYYVLRNGEPANRLSLRLLVKAGGVHEDNDQFGAAHFVEHLAFDGTRNLKKNDIISFIRGAGMSWGADLHGQARLDSTEYRLTVPTDAAGEVQKAMAFLREVASNVSFDPAEIERERRVLIEESGNELDVDKRAHRAQLAMALAGSRYADHLAPDSPAELGRATRETLLRFYRDWYRPDTMALIAVGSTDPNSLVRDIERTFGNLKSPAWKRPATVPDVPYNEELLVKVVTDPELTGTNLAFFSRFENELRGKSEMRQTLSQDLVTWMMVQRLRFGRTPAAAFQVTSLSFPTITRGVQLVSYAGAVRDGELEPNVYALFAEFASASRYGFSQPELYEAMQAAAGYVNQHLRANVAQSSEDSADALEDLVLRKMPYRDRAQMLRRMQELLPAITLEEVNAWARKHDGTKGAMLFVSGPTGVAVPTEAELRVLARQASLTPTQRR